NEPLKKHRSFLVGARAGSGLSPGPQRLRKSATQYSISAGYSHLARVEIASQREAKTVILQSNRCLVQKRDLASHAQSLLRIGDHLRRQSHTLNKGRHWYAGAFEARDSQAGKPPSRRRD